MGTTRVKSAGGIRKRTRTRRGAPSGSRLTPSTGARKASGTRRSRTKAAAAAKASKPGRSSESNAAASDVSSGSDHAMQLEAVSMQEDTAAGGAPVAADSRPELIIHAATTADEEATATNTTASPTCASFKVLHSSCQASFAACDAVSGSHAWSSSPAESAGTCVGAADGTPIIMPTAASMQAELLHHAFSVPSTADNAAQLQLPAGATQFPQQERSSSCSPVALGFHHPLQQQELAWAAAGGVVDPQMAQHEEVLRQRVASDKQLRDQLHERLMLLQARQARERQLQQLVQEQQMQALQQQMLLEQQARLQMMQQQQLQQQAPMIAMPSAWQQQQQIDCHQQRLMHSAHMAAWTHAAPHGFKHEALTAARNSAAAFDVSPPVGSGPYPADACGMMVGDDVQDCLLPPLGADDDLEGLLDGCCPLAVDWDTMVF